jgi:Spy/CpxP family protein refolding chaperone
MKFTTKYIGVTTLLTLAAASSAFAAGTSDTASQKNISRTNTKKGAYVQSETETQEQKDVIATSLAQALGTTKEAILQDLNAGKSPREIIAASGKDEAAVTAKLDATRNAAMKTTLAEKVAKGTITQAKADEILARMNTVHTQTAKTTKTTKSKTSANGKVKSSTSK